MHPILGMPLNRFYCQRLGLGRQHVQVRPLCGQPIRRRLPGSAMHPSVDVLAPRITCRDQLSERGVAAAQAGLRESWIVERLAESRRLAEISLPQQRRS